MLMKYKDFKMMDENAMKQVMGGFAPNCGANVTCGNGHTYSCAGNTGTYQGGQLGCSASDGNGATCFYQDDNNNWAFAQITCQNGTGVMSWGTVQA